jgi:hypothetical protein
LNKGYVGLIVYLIFVLCAPILIAGYYFAPRDVSWIGPVEDFIRKDWKPNAKFYGFDDAFFLYENGKEQFFFLNDSQREFISYMNGLTGKVDRQLKSSISRESVDGILAADKVLAFVHRFPEGFGNRGLYGSAEVEYFILGDKLGIGMEGGIIMQDRLSGESSQFSVWQITNLVL